MYPYDKLCFITRVYIKYLLSVGTTFNAVPRFNTSMTLFSRSICTFIFEKKIITYLEIILSCVGKVDKNKIIHGYKNSSTYVV